MNRPGVLSLALLLLLPGVARADVSADDLEFFESRVRPVLAEHCYDCHGPDKERGNLRLDHIQSILTGGDRGPEIVPGKPDESRLIEAIRYDNVDLQMPPRSRLSESQIADLTKWVEKGAPWPDEPLPGGGAKEEFDLEARRDEHWVWQPNANPPMPEVKTGGWAKDPVDFFVLERLEANGLKPAKPADRRTWMRRVYLDLIGLPPTPEEVRSFLEDRSPDAHEKVVDRLLASSHHGERWGRHWLDLVRYAETYGHEFDYPIAHAWQYRDYVIRAINEDVPYDQFVTEHIAGDQLPDPRRNPEKGYNESIIGTGFWFFSQATHAPVDVRGDEAERVANQIDVFTKTFLGLTVACARCHDHKFDAISAADFYGLAGFLQSSRRQEAMLDPGGEIATAAKELTRWHQSGRGPVAYAVPTPAGASRDPVDAYLLAAREVEFGEPRPGDEAFLPPPPTVFADFEDGTFDGWTAEGEAFAKGPAAGTLPHQNPVTGFRGKYLVNSYQGGDGTTGKLTSDPFTLEQPFIRFLIGGGNHKRKTCINLVIEGKTVRTATGKNNEKLELHVWDVAEFMGKSAFLEIVDNQGGGWGHVNIDQIEFASESGTDRGRRPHQAVARERELDEERLERWFRALRDPVIRRRDHPLRPWHHVAGRDGPLGDDVVRKRLEELAGQYPETEKEPPDRVFETFERGYGDWFVTGQAFGDRPTSRRDWRARSTGWEILPPGMAHSGRVAGRLQGVLRSPTFEIDSDFIHYRMAGQGGKIRVIIDGYVMDVFNALLFKGISFDVNTKEEFTWHSQRVAKYRGHRAHIEIIDAGDGFVAVDEIRFSDRGAVDPAARGGGVRGLFEAGSLDALAAGYQALWQRELDGWLSLRAGSGVELTNWLLRHDLIALDGADEVASRVKRMDEKARKTPRPMRVIAMADGSGEDEFVFVRGSHKSLGPRVPRRFLEAISGADQAEIPRGSGRLELARRLLDGSNPLPTRVLVNRVWHHLFGRGLVPTTDDFGVLGRPPSHPELLDHLAHWFRHEGGWSRKRLLRRLVLSSTYRMASDPSDPRAEEKDPTNQWLHRMRIRRLEGEAIRDLLLTVSGRLDRKLYGAPVATHLTAFMDGRGKPRKSGPLDGQGRRSIYLEVRRNFLNPFMLAFDTPIPHSTVGRRTISNVPAQALILMNNPLVIELARHLGASLAARTDESAADRITELYQVALSRDPHPGELENLLAFRESQARAHDAENPDPESEAVWADLGHVVFNLKEFIFVR